jgi:hypothetical protein
MWVRVSSRVACGGAASGGRGGGVGRWLLECCRSRVISHCQVSVGCSSTGPASSAVHAWPMCWWQGWHAAGKYGQALPFNWLHLAGFSPSWPGAFSQAGKGRQLLECCRSRVISHCQVSEGCSSTGPSSFECMHRDCAGAGGRDGMQLASTAKRCRVAGCNRLRSAQAGPVRSARRASKAGKGRQLLECCRSRVISHCQVSEGCSSTGLGAVACGLRLVGCGSLDAMHCWATRMQARAQARDPGPGCRQIWPDSSLCGLLCGAGDAGAHGIRWAWQECV